MVIVKHASEDFISGQCQQSTELCSTAEINVMQLLTFGPAPPLSIKQLLLILAQLGQSNIANRLAVRKIRLENISRRAVEDERSEVLNDKFVSITLITINISLYSPPH